MQVIGLPYYKVYKQHTCTFIYNLLVLLIVK